MLFIKNSFLILIFSLILLPPQLIEAKKDKKFDVASIPSELTEDADAIIRMNQLRFEVKSRKEAIEKRHWVVTIFNENGRDFGEVIVPYDKFCIFKTSKLKGHLRDVNGKVIRKLKKSDIEDRSAISGYSLYEDSRVCIAKLYHDVYPYTVDFEYEIRHNGLINWTTWYPQRQEEPVEYASFELIAPKGMEIRYTTRGMELEPIITERKKQQVYHWERSMLPLREIEPLGPSWQEQRASVRAAPTEFEIAGIKGEMSSWKSFGNWYYELSKDRNELPQERATEVQKISSGTASDLKKIAKLYELMQKETRYVSVQLGIGGWQPFDAKYVSKNKYGDCKALTNYMMTLLNAVDIPAYPALIRAGRNVSDVIADFPSNQFNHVILYVPLKADTIWLECTSQTSPFGHLGTFTEDRYALVVTADGGELHRTPKSRPVDNQQIHYGTVTLKETGDATAKIKAHYSGNQQDIVRYALAQRSDRDREEWLRDQLLIPTFRLTWVDFTDVDSKQKVISLPFELELPRYTSRSGSRLFLQPNLMNHWRYVPRKMENRTQPVHLSYTYIEADTIFYQLPEGYSVESLPDPVFIEMDFGSYYAASIVIEDKTLQYSRRIEITKNRMPPEKYEEYRSFVKQIVQADQKKVVLLKKNK